MVSLFPLGERSAQRAQFRFPLITEVQAVIKSQLNQTLFAVEVIYGSGPTYSLNAKK